MSLAPATSASPGEIRVAAHGPLAQTALAGLLGLHRVSWAEADVVLWDGRERLPPTPAAVLFLAPEADTPPAGVADVIPWPARPGYLSHRIQLLAELIRLRRWNKALTVAVESVSQGISIADAQAPDQPLIYVNPAFETITGFSAKNVLGRNCRFLQGPDTEPTPLQLLRLAVQQRQEVQVTLQNYRRDGTPFRNELRVVPVSEGHQAPYFVGIQREVTPLTETRAQLAAARLQLSDRQSFVERVMDGIPIGILTADAQGQVTFANRAAMDILARPALDRLPLNLRDFFGPQDISQILPTAVQESRRVTSRVRRPDGAQLHLGLTVARAPGGPDGIRLFVVFRELSGSREIEVESSRLERLAAMGTMVSGFAHEVRNPVASIAILTEELEAEIPPGDPRRVPLAKIGRHLGRIERLVRASLEFGRPEPPRRAHHSPATLVEAAVDALRPRTRTLGDIRVIGVTRKLPDLYVDDAQLIQALVILLNNALDATGHGDQVTVSAQVRGRHLQLEVVDNGPGVPDHLANRIFDPFFSTKPQGTGLGLPMAQRLIHDNGGSLELRSTPGRGATFCISFAGPNP